MNLAREFKEFRELNNLTQAQFAKIAGLKRGTYAQYELGRRTPNNENMQKVELGQRRVIAKRDLSVKTIEDMHKRAVERYQRVVELNKPSVKKNKRVLLKFLIIGIIVLILVILY
jgi:transcriptional regulator with XRE-family HTH domain